MEVNVNVKRTKTRKRKRHSKLKRREQQGRLEVRFAKRRKLLLERNVPLVKSKDKLTMQANTFWENYEAAFEWQRRHSVEWWRSRCVALEQENAVLRDKIRELASRSVQKRTLNPSEKQKRRQVVRSANFDREGGNDPGDNDDDDQCGEGNPGNDRLEFQVDEDMMKFFEQSIRHKLEMKKKRDDESAMEKAELERDTPIEGGAAWMEAKIEGAKLLYGVASPRILAMETALQATIDRHKDRAKPQYWPNIPFNL